MSISTSQSHTCSSSLRSCDDTSTVRPVPARPPISERISRTPCGSRPLAGSSRISSVGIAEQGGGDAEPLLHAERVAAVAVVAPVAEADGVEQRRDRRPVSWPADGGEHPQVLGAGERRVEGGALDQRADLGQVRGRVGRSSGRARCRCRRWAGRGRAAWPWWWSCRRRWGRRTRRRRRRAARCRGRRRRFGRRSAWSVRSTDRAVECHGSIVTGSGPVAVVGRAGGSSRLPPGGRTRADLSQPAGADEAGLVGEHHQLGPVAGAELDHRPAHVGLGRGRAHDRAAGRSRRW